MRIKNTTKWDTSDLRKLFSRCIKEVKKIEGRGKNKGIKVYVKNDNRDVFDICGRGWLGYYEMSIKVGIEIDLMNLDNRKRLAHIFTHEYFHNLGYRQQDYNNYKGDWTARMNYDFVKDCQIKEAVIKTKPKRDLRMERYQTALAYVKTYETKVKRTKNLLKKWKQKQRYYERVLTAAGKINIEK